MKRIIIVVFVAFLSVACSGTEAEAPPPAAACPCLAQCVGAAAIGCSCQPDLDSYLSCFETRAAACEDEYAPCTPGLCHADPSPPVASR